MGWRPSDNQVAGRDSDSPNNRACRLPRRRHGDATSVALGDFRVTAHLVRVGTIPASPLRDARRKVTDAPGGFPAVSPRTRHGGPMHRLSAHPMPDAGRLREALRSGLDDLPDADLLDRFARYADHPA